jgi:hypothetical protein
MRTISIKSRHNPKRKKTKANNQQKSGKKILCKRGLMTTKWQWVKTKKKTKLRRKSSKSSFFCYCSLPPSYLSYCSKMTAICNKELQCIHSIAHHQTEPTNLIRHMCFSSTCRCLVQTWVNSTKLRILLARSSPPPPPPFWTYVQEPFETHSPTIITTTTTTTPFDLKKKSKL